MTGDRENHDEEFMVPDEKPAVETPQSESSPLTPVLHYADVLAEGSVGVQLLVGSEPFSTVKVECADELILGRTVIDSEHQPDLDLSPYGAQNWGVSRRHAKLVRDDNTLSVVDLGSTGGTYVNRIRVLAWQSRVLCDGDELRLGSFRIRVFFRFNQAD